MIENLINKIKRLNKTKFRFDLPMRNKILQYDEINSNILKLIIKKNFNIMPRHNPEIFFWIFLKRVVFLEIASYPNVELVNIIFSNLSIIL